MAECVLDHDKPTSAQDGLYVCRGHRNRLERSVAELPSTYEDLTLALRRQSTSGPKITGQGEEPTFVSGPVVDVRASIVACLASWSRLVAEDRGLSGPASAEPEWTAAFLTTHLDWLCAQPFADEAANELLELSSRAWSLAYPSGRRRIALGPCVEDGCSGTLTAVVRQTDDLLPSAIACDQDEEHAWEADKWLALGRRIHDREVA